MSLARSHAGARHSVAGTERNRLSLTSDLVGNIRAPRYERAIKRGYTDIDDLTRLKGSGMTDARERSTRYCCEFAISRHRRLLLTEDDRCSHVLMRIAGMRMVLRNAVHIRDRTRKRESEESCPLSAVSSLVVTISKFDKNTYPIVVDVFSIPFSFFLTFFFALFPHFLAFLFFFFFFLCFSLISLPLTNVDSVREND